MGVNRMHTAKESFGYGKLLLFGEYSALIGGRALGISLPSRLVLKREHTPPVTRGPRNAALQALEVDGYVLHAKTIDKNLQRAFVRFRELLREKESIQGQSPTTASESPRGQHFSLDSNIPFAQGFGSSAALAAALAGFLATGEERRRYALLFEHMFHGRASGVDSSIALQEREKQLCTLSFDIVGGAPKVETCTGAIPHLVVASTPRKSNAAELIERVMQEMPLSVLKALGDIAARAIRIVHQLSGQGGAEKERSFHALGECANQAQEALRTLRVHTTEQDRLLQIGLDAGALGAKLSGAGGGGAFYYICKDGKQAKKLAETLTNEVSNLFVL